MREHRQHSDSDIRAALAFALEVVADLEVDDELRGIAFAKAVDNRLAKTQFWHPADQMPIVDQAATLPNRAMRRHGDGG